MSHVVIILYVQQINMLVHFLIGEPNRKFLRGSRIPFSSLCNICWKCWICWKCCFDFQTF